MEVTAEDDIKRRKAKRKAALLMEFIHGKASVTEVSSSFDISLSEIVK
jgi:hypothetical protein